MIISWLLLAHSVWRWVVLVALIVAAADGVMGVVGKRDWQPRSTTIARVMAVVVDIQVLLGLLLYVAGREWEEADPFFKMIHPVIMLGVLAVTHVTASRTRKGETSRGRHMWLAVGSIVALLLALAGGAVGLASTQ